MKNIGPHEYEEGMYGKECDKCGLKPREATEDMWHTDVCVRCGEYWVDLFAFPGIDGSSIPTLLCSSCSITYRNNNMNTNLTKTNEDNSQKGITMNKNTGNSNEYDVLTTCDWCNTWGMNAPEMCRKLYADNGIWVMSICMPCDTGTVERWVETCECDPGLGNVEYTCNCGDQQSIIVTNLDEANNINNQKGNAMNNSNSIPLKVVQEINATIDYDLLQMELVGPRDKNWCFMHTEPVTDPLDPARPGFVYIGSDYYGRLVLREGMYCILANRSGAERYIPINLITKSDSCVCGGQGVCESCDPGYLSGVDININNKEKEMNDFNREDIVIRPYCCAVVIDKNSGLPRSCGGNNIRQMDVVSRGGELFSMQEGNLSGGFSLNANLCKVHGDMINNGKRVKFDKENVIEHHSFISQDNSDLCGLCGLVDGFNTYHTTEVSYKSGILEALKEVFTDINAKEDHLAALPMGPEDIPGHVEEMQVVPGALRCNKCAKEGKVQPYHENKQGIKDCCMGKEVRNVIKGEEPKKIVNRVQPKKKVVFGPKTDKQYPCKVCGGVHFSQADFKACYMTRYNK